MRVRDIRWARSVFCFPTTRLFHNVRDGPLRMPATTTKLTAERFVEFVTDSELVEPEAIERLLDKVRRHLGGRLPASPRKLAKVFVREGLLTDWHVKKLLDGKYKGFFIGKYKLLGHIGTGGMSSVYKAQHVRMGDMRAIKVLPKSRVADATYLARFQLEAKAIASLNHPNIVLAYDIDNEGDVHYIVMEFVRGDDLQKYVKENGPLEFSNAAEIIAQAARGLQHAHERGVVHRDIKPANVLVDETGTVKLLDMGLARMAADDEESLTVANNENVLGTADYLAPEQALNSHEVDHRADIYGLGCTMYFLLTGSPPYADGTLAQRIAKHQSKTEQPPPVKKFRPDFPGELDGVLLKMIQKDPKYRYQKASDVAEALERFVAAVPVGTKITGGLGDAPEPDDSPSSITLEEPAGVSTTDTTKASGGDTLADARRHTINEGISSGDSGRLVRLPPKLFRDEGSFLDLQAESGYRPSSNPKIARSTPSGVAVAPSPHNSPSDVQIGAESEIYGSGGRSRGSASRRRGVDTPLLVALGIALFIVAATIGFILARVTS